MIRLTVLCLATASLAQVLPSGCLLEDVSDPVGEPGVLDTQAGGPETANVGETVTLTAAVSGRNEGVEVSYRWMQVYGRVVTLQNGTSPEASFLAPSLPSDKVLRFRVETRTARGDAGSAEVSVTVAKDPNYVGSTGSAGGTGPGNTGSDPNSTGQPGNGTNNNGSSSGSGDDAPKVRLVTSKGTIVLILDRGNAPVTVENFLKYVNAGFYDGIIFHRVIADFVIQSGGFKAGMVEVEPTYDPIENEGDNGLQNNRGTIAMARTGDPDSATSQFFINLVDNDNLNATSSSPGYAVFGFVLEGLDVVDAIGAVETHETKGHQDVPVADILIQRAEVVTDDIAGTTSSGQQSIFTGG